MFFSSLLTKALLHKETYPCLGAMWTVGGGGDLSQKWAGKFSVFVAQTVTPVLDGLYRTGSSGHGRIIQIPAGVVSLGEYRSLIHRPPCAFNRYAS